MAYLDVRSGPRFMAFIYSAVATSGKCPVFKDPSDPAFAPRGAWRSVGLAANLTLRNFAAVLGSRLRSAALLRPPPL